VKAAMEFLCDEWLVDVATDHTGNANLRLQENGANPSKQEKRVSPGL
jgi:hypothetical protein